MYKRPAREVLLFATALSAAFVFFMIGNRFWNENAWQPLFELESCL